MPNLYYTIGLPASGKTTMAREMLAQDVNLVRINKDDLRQTLYAGTKWNGRREQMVIQMQTAMIAAAISKNKNIIIDDTNLNPVHVDRFETMVRDTGYILKNLDFTDVSMQTCIQRDATRDKKVGANVITKMALQYGLETVNDGAGWIGVDLDGTLADIASRRELSLLSPDPKTGRQRLNWDKFFDPDNIQMDVPRNDVIRQVHDLAHETGAKIVILSGRSDRTYDATVNWLYDNFGVKFWDYLIMRQDGDNRSDDVLKLEFLDLYLDADSCHMIFDDRKRVIEAWESRGLPVKNVAIGDNDF